MRRFSFKLLVSDDYTQVEKALQSMGSLIKTIVEGARAYVDFERETVFQAKALAHTAASTEVTRLREQNALLARMLESEKIKADKAKDDLIQRVSGLLGEFTSARDRSLREAFNQVQVSNQEAEESMLQFGANHGEIMDSMLSRGGESAATLDKGGADGKRTRDGALKVS